MSRSRDVQSMRFGAVLIFLGGLLSGAGAMLIVARVARQPAWVDVHTMAQRYHPVQALPYVLGFVLLFGFVYFVAACRRLAASEHMVRANAAVIFTAVYASLVFLNYTLQVGFVPRALADESPVLALLTMNNPVSLAWFLEMFGYGALGVATWLLAPIFGGSGRGTLVRWLMVVNGIGSIASAALTAMIDGFVFTPAACSRSRSGTC